MATYKKAISMPTTLSSVTCNTKEGRKEGREDGRKGGRKEGRE
jgi:hypothetical protein